jgi:hypothetical protein
MIAGFCLIIYGGPLALMITVSLNIYLFEQSNKSFLFIFFTFKIHIYFIDVNRTSEMFRRNY